MSTLSQFFLNGFQSTDTSKNSSGVWFLGSSSTVTIPNTARYLAYGVIGAGAPGFAICGFGGSGGGFSWWEGPLTNTSPLSLCATVATSNPAGGTTSVTGGPQNICATSGGYTCSGFAPCVVGIWTNCVGCGVGGLINTNGGNSCSACYNSGCNRSSNGGGGGAGGLFDNGGASAWGAGGGFGSGGGGGGAQGWQITPAYQCNASGYTSARGAGGGQPAWCTAGGMGLNANRNTHGYQLMYTQDGFISQSKTFLSASGGGADVGNWAGAGGGGSNYTPGGFASPGGFGGGGAAVEYFYGYNQCQGKYGLSSGGCGGGGGAYCGCFCCCCDNGGGVCTLTGCANTAGGNGFVTVEYWV